MIKRLNELQLENKTNQIKKSNKMKEHEKKENLIDEDIDLGRFFELGTSKKVYVIGLNLHEIKRENLLDYTGDFELNGLLVIGRIEHKANIRY